MVGRMLKPPVPPMLAKLSASLPEGDGWLYEPKWDGFRALVFRDGDDVYVQSRDLKPLDRYFPELLEPLKSQLPGGCVLDGEIVIAGEHGLDFDALLLRIHPAASRATAPSPAAAGAPPAAPRADPLRRARADRTRRTTRASAARAA